MATQQTSNVQVHILLAVLPEVSRNSEFLLRLQTRTTTVVGLSYAGFLKEYKNHHTECEGNDKSTKQATEMLFMVDYQRNCHLCTYINFGRPVKPKPVCTSKCAKGAKKQRGRRKNGMRWRNYPCVRVANLCFSGFAMTTQVKRGRGVA